MNLWPILTAALVAAQSAPWSGFRNGGNQSLEASGYPLSWSPTQNVAWKVALPGYGQSTPVVGGGRVFVTAVPGRQRAENVVACLDSRTGKTLWERRLPAGTAGDLHDMVSRAAPTPILDGDSLYAFFESGDLVRLAAKDGRVEWQRNLFQEYGEFKNGHGLGCSPAHTKDALVLLIDHQGPSYLLSVDKRTGATRWKTERPERSSWTSPLVAKQGDREVVIASSSGDVQAYDAGTGEALWKFEGITGNHIPSPVADGERVYVGAAIPRGGRAGAPRTPAQSNLALKLVDQAGKPGVELAWEGRRAVCEYGSPTLHRGLLYTVNSAGVAFCVDAATGEEKYSERVDAACWVAPLAIGDHVYFFGRNGVTTVVKAGPTFQKVASNRLWEVDSQPLPGVDYTPPKRPERAGEGGPSGGGAPRGGGAPAAGPLDPCVYGVAAAEGRFFIRVGTHLFCVRP